MKTWLTVKDLSEYLSIAESKIQNLVRQKGIPFYNHHGFLRFNREKIDNWMMHPSSADSEKIRSEVTMNYRNRPITDYVLTVSKILIGKTPLERLPVFIKKTVQKTREKNKEYYLYRDEFLPSINNFNDYLRVCCQLGLIDKEQDEGRRKRYHITPYAIRISEGGNEKQIILESILNIVQQQQETIPDERHAIILLWYFLTLKANGITPAVEHFVKSDRERTNFYPQIRLAFSKSLCEFLFDNDEVREREFLVGWNEYL
jgi:excisionase family DNA binding protein